MKKIMAILNLTPDSFWAPSRSCAEEAPARIAEMLAKGASIIDIGAVSTRPGAADVGVEEEWERLRPVLCTLASSGPACRISIDTVSAEIVRRTYDTIGDFIVNDISAGEDDPEMLQTVGHLGLEYVAMHKRGNPRTMDSLAGYGDVVEDLCDYFADFGRKAEEAGIENWILDPGLGFAKTKEQNFEIIERLAEFKKIGRPILIGAADKRFTEGNTSKYHRMALRNGADILRVHDVDAAVADIAAVSGVEE